MMLRHFAVIAAGMIPLMLASGCGQTAAPAISLRANRLNQLHSIASKCGLPDSVLKLVGTKELHVQPPPDAAYENVECLLAELRKANLPVSIAFIGNEAYQPEEKNAPSH